MKHKPIKYGKKLADIAQSVGCSPATVSKHLKMVPKQNLATQ
jgi:DNA-binding CsgD family transcriptional regulator